MKNIPKIIWHWWEQGWDNAPYAVKMCSQSLDVYANDWKVINVDKYNIFEYIDHLELFNIDNYPKQLRSDIIRILLLSRWGGVWIDSTVFLNINLTNFTSSQNIEDFFCFWRWKNKIAMSSWFLVATERSYVAQKMATEFVNLVLSREWLDKNSCYFASWRGSPDYFIFHRTFENLAKRDPEFNKIIKEMNFVDSFPMLNPTLNGWNEDASNDTILAIENSVPMFKLSYSINKETYNDYSTLGFLLKKMSGESAPNFRHIHTPCDFRSIQLYDSYINNPSKISSFSGPIISESNLGILEKGSKTRWHVLNYTNKGNNGYQLLFPFNENRMFIRTQRDSSSYNSVREVAYSDQIEQLEQKIKDINRYGILLPLVNVVRYVYSFSKRAWRSVRRSFTNFPND